MSRQAIETKISGNGHCNCVAPSGRGGLAKQKLFGRSTGRRLAPGCVGCPPGGYKYKIGLRGGFYTALDGGIDAMFCWAQLRV